MANVIDESTADPLVAKWVREINTYEQQSQKYRERCRKILKRYKDERNPNESIGIRYNILWAFNETLRPALYAREPQVVVDRRFKDKDDVARLAADVLERATHYMMKDQDFSNIIRQSVDDYILLARGVTWERYIPHFGPEMYDEGSEVTDDVETGEDAEENGPEEVVTWEESHSDYVYWEDFGHTIDRTWEEVRGVWRKVYLTRKALVRRFGEEIGNQVPLNYSPKNLSGEKVSNGRDDRACIYEIWDKENEQVIWLSKGYQKTCDVLPDPLRLKGFFPCPRPMYGTLTTDSLIPTPDYIEWQDQAQELDRLTARIGAITKAIKVAGVYDTSANGLQRVLSEGVENELIPVDGWAAFAEKGGLAGTMSLLPVQEIAQTLLSLYEARDKVKQDLYEITGMADIIRGANDPNATATAERIKSKFITLRLSERQKEVQRFIRDLLAIKGEIIAKHFSIETIRTISGLALLSNAEKQQIQMQQQQYQQVAQQAQSHGMQPPPPPNIPADVQAQLSQPSWEEIDALLKNDPLRCFRIDIETDSTIIDDEEAEKQARVEFIQAVGGFMKDAIPAVDNNPQLAPIMGSMLLFGVRAFRAGRELEGQFEQLVDQMEEMAKNPPQKPDPETQKAQAQAQIEQQKGQITLQVEQQKAQVLLQSKQQELQMQDQFNERQAQRDMQMEQWKQQVQAQQVAHQNQLEAQRDQLQAQNEAALEQMRLALDERLGSLHEQMALLIAQMNNARAIEVAEIAAGSTLQAAQMSAANSASQEE